MLLGSARTLERDHPAVVFEVERKLFAEHEPRAPIRLLRDRYKYTCFKPVPCGTQPRSFGSWVNGGGGLDHLCLWDPERRFEVRQVVARTGQHSQSVG